MSTLVPPQGYQANPLVLRETAPVGAPTLETGELFTKDVGGRTEFFYEDDLGVQIQLTSGGKINAAALALGLANQLLGINAAGTAVEFKTLTAGTGISIVHTAGVATISNTGKPASFTQTYADHYADGSNNNCDSIREWDAADNVVWNKITPLANGQGLQCVYAISLPTGFSGFAAATALEIAYKTINSTPFVQVVEVVDSVGVSIVAGFPAAAQNAAKSTITVTAAMLAGGTFTADTVIYVIVEGYGDTGTPFSTETAMIGPVKANFA